MDKPSFIVGMLENLGSFINPLRLVQRIPKDLEIPGLKNAIIKIMSDFSIQVSLRQGCEKILLSDTTDLLEQLHKAQIAALQIDSNDTCSICKNLLINRDGNQSEDNVVVLFCRHAFHSHCLNISERQVLDSEVILLKKMAKADGIVYRGKAEDDMMMNSTKSIDFDKPFVCTICGS